LMDLLRGDLGDLDRTPHETATGDVYGT